MRRARRVAGVIGALPKVALWIAEILVLAVVLILVCVFLEPEDSF